MSSHDISRMQVREVAFIIILHGDPPHFDRTLASIDAQRCEPGLQCKVYCLDDGTSSAAVATATARGTEVFSLPEGSGIALAKHLAATVAKEEFLFFVDSHMVLESDALHHAISALQSDCSLSGVCGCYRAEEASDCDRLRDLKRHVLYGKGDTSRDISLQAFTTFSMGLGVLRRDALRAAPFPSELFLQNIGGEDLPFLMTMITSGKKLRYLPTVRAMHCHSMNGLAFLKKLHIEVSGRFPVYWWLCSNGHVRTPYLPGFLTFPLLLVLASVVGAVSIATGYVKLGVGFIAVAALYESWIPAAVLVSKQGDWSLRERVLGFLYLVASEVLTLIYSFIVFLPGRCRPFLRHLSWRKIHISRLLQLFTVWEVKKLRYIGQRLGRYTIYHSMKK